VHSVLADKNIIRELWSTSLNLSKVVHLKKYNEAGKVKSFPTPWPMGSEIYPEMYLGPSRFKMSAVFFPLHVVWNEPTNNMAVAKGFVE
jgi:hypothetical protein